MGYSRVSMQSRIRQATLRKHRISVLSLRIDLTNDYRILVNFPMSWVIQEYDCSNTQHCTVVSIIGIYISPWLVPYLTLLHQGGDTMTHAARCCTTHSLHSLKSTVIVTCLYRPNTNSHIEVFAIKYQFPLTMFILLTLNIFFL